MARMIGTKTKIQQIGRSLLQKHGYHGFSFLDIANQIGIRKASIFEHYDSKEALIVAILDAYSADFKKWTEGMRDLAPEIQIQRIFELFHSFAKDRGKVCPVLALSVDPGVLSTSVTRALDEFLNSWLVWLTERIQEGQKQGKFRKDLDAALLSRLVYGLGMGSQLEVRLLRDQKLPKKLGAATLKLLKGDEN